MKTKHVCLFGTSANPPTNECGHLGIIQHLETMDFDEIWVLPVYSHMFAVRFLWYHFFLVVVKEFLLLLLLFPSHFCPLFFFFRTNEIHWRILNIDMKCVNYYFKTKKK